MSSFIFPIEEWFERIGYRGPVDASEATLVGIHRAQAFAIPFENLDPLTGRTVSLEPERLVQKLVRSRRGGYCYELNGLLLLALRRLGFRAWSLTGRTLIRAGVYGARFHQITMVEIHGRAWLVDVGFGGNGLLEPLPFEMERETDQKLDRFRITPDAGYGFRLEHWLKDHWRTLYSFSLDPFLPADYALMNFSVSKSPDSLLTQVPICTRPTETARLILTGNEFKIRSANAPRIIPVPTGEALEEILLDHFGVEWKEAGPLPTPAPFPQFGREI